MSKKWSLVSLISGVLFLISCGSSANTFKGIIKEHLGNNYPISNRKIAFCQVQSSEEVLKLPFQCTLFGKIAVSDEDGHFEFSDVPVGMYIFLYDSGLASFDKAVQNLAGEQITVGPTEWVGSELQGNEDGSVEITVFPNNEISSLMLHCEEKFVIDYLITHMIVPESPFIVAHDVDRSAEECDINIIVAFMPPKDDNQTVTFHSFYLGDTASTAESSATPILVGTKQYEFAPPMLIDVTREYYATVKMAKGGEFVIQLYPDKAPITVNSFVFLARNGYFDGVTFHRVLDGFMAQGGDPTGSGAGSPGYSFVNEINDLAFDKAGVVAMANAGKDTNGSQFFITFNPLGLAESDYTIFGQVISGMDVVNGITRRDPNTSPDFPGDSIETVTISEE